MRAVWSSVALALCAAALGAEAQEKQEKLSKVDRARVVGTPVLEKAPRGIHVWLEDGWYRVAAISLLPEVSTEKLRKSFTVTVRSTKSIESLTLEDWKRAGAGEHVLSLAVLAGAEPEVLKFKTEGDLTVEAATMEGHPTPIFVGPLSKPAAATVRIGRF